MTRVQQTTLALMAAVAVVFACAFAMAMPQQAHAAETKLVAGSTFDKATNLSLTDATHASSNRSEFNSKNDNNFYRFTTSNRDSRYKLTLRSYDGYRIYVTIYDASHHRIAYMSTTSKKGQSWTFKNLSRNSVYYVELWRFVVDGSNYLQSGSVLDMGYAESAYPKYKITLKEVITKPKLSNFKATSPSKNKMKLTYDTSYNTDGVQVEFWWSWQSKKTKANTFYRYPTKSSYTATVKYAGKTKPYKVRVRPYQMVNGKRLYGSWTGWKKLVIKAS